MTYIVAGCLPDQNFMMVDCISTDPASGNLTLNDKVCELTTIKGAYYTLCGNSVTNYALNLYEIRASQKKIETDYFTGTASIKSFVGALQYLVSKGPPNLKLTYNRIIFIDKERLVYHDLEFNSDNSLKSHIGPVIVPEGYYVDSAVGFGKDKIEFEKDETIESFCKRNFEPLMKVKSLALADLKNRITFLQLFRNGNTNHHRPFLYFSDLVACYFASDYKNIDDPGEIWDI